MGYPMLHQGPRVTWSHMGHPMMVYDQYFIEKNTELMFKTSLLFEVARCSPKISAIRAVFKLLIEMRERSSNLKQMDVQSIFWFTFRWKKSY